MDCQKFLANYSAWRDGCVSWAEREAFEAHAEECAACARYDRVVQGGAQVFRQLPELEVSEDFGERLRHRLYHVDEEMRAQRRGASPAQANATLAIAAMLAAAAWIPLMQPREHVQRLPAVAATAPRTGIVRRLLLSPLHQEATGISSRLAQMGVAVQEMPYHDQVFRPQGPLTGELAVFTPPVAEAAPLP